MYGRGPGTSRAPHEVAPESSGRVDACTGRPRERFLRRGGASAARAPRFLVRSRDNERKSAWKRRRGARHGPRRAGRSSPPTAREAAGGTDACRRPRPRVPDPSSQERERIRRSRHGAAARTEGYLVYTASSHMLVSKIKPCKCKYELSYSETANGSLNQLWFI